MPFPESQRVIFRNNPITQVIAQLRFPTILAIGATEPAQYQGLIRREYPLYSREGVPPELPSQLAGFIRQLGAMEGRTHLFSTAEKERSIALTPDYIAVDAKKYHRWEEFANAVSMAQSSLVSVYEPPFYNRVGLRYLDVIDRKQLGLGDEPWSELINDELIGLLGAPALRDEVSEILTVASVKIASVPGATVRLRHGLQSATPVDAPDDPRAVYVVDADFFTNQRTENNDVANILGRFNHIAGNLFRWAIKPRLRDALDPVPVV